MMTLQVLRLSAPSFAPLASSSLSSLDVRLSAHAGSPSSLDSEEPAGVGGALVGSSVGESKVVDGSRAGGSGSHSSMLLLSEGEEAASLCLGETFRTFVAFHNSGNVPLTDVSFRIELHTNSQPYSLIDAPSTTSALSGPGAPGGGSPDRANIGRDPVPELQAGASVHFVVLHELKELGKHTLRASASYLLPSGERDHFTGKVKFGVVKPLDIFTRFPAVTQDAIYLEAEIQNATQDPLFLDSVRLEPSAGLVAVDMADAVGGDARDLAAPSPDAIAMLDFDALMAQRPEDLFLQPGNSRQFLFKISPNAKGGIPLRSVAAVGKLDIQWKSHFGGAGRLQTLPLERSLPELQEGLSFAFHALPDVIYAESPFEAVIAVANDGTTSRDLLLHVAKSTVSRAVTFDGVSGTLVGTVAPSQVLHVPVTLFAHTPGVHVVTGIQFVDASSGSVFDVDGLDPILVVGNVDPQPST